MEQERNYMTITAAAQTLGYSRKMIYALAKRGELTIIRDPNFIHGPTKIPKEDIERLLAKRRAADPPA